MIVEDLTPLILAIGCGGAGNNTISTLHKRGLKGVQLIAVNTDAQQLLRACADKKLLLGKDCCKGQGAGNEPRLGEMAALESSEAIDSMLPADAVSPVFFIVGGLGGGTGTGAMPVIAAQAKAKGMLTIAVVSLPFRMEGQRRKQNSMEGLDKLKQSCDAVVVLPNDRLLGACENLPLVKAFERSDTIASDVFEGIFSLISNPGLVNLAFADIKEVLKDAGISMISKGSSGCPFDAVSKALANPFLAEVCGSAKKALIHIRGSKDVTLAQAQQAIELVQERMSDNAALHWGVSLDSEGDASAFIMLSGLTMQEAGYGQG